MNLYKVKVMIDRELDIVSLVPARFAILRFRDSLFTVPDYCLPFTLIVLATGSVMGWLCLKLARCLRDAAGPESPTVNA